MINPINWPCFHFIRISVVGLAISLVGIDGLVIGDVVSIDADVAVDFFELSLW